MERTDEDGRGNSYPFLKIYNDCWINTYKVATCSLRQVCGGCTILMGKAGNILYKISFFFPVFYFCVFHSRQTFFRSLFSALMVIHHRQYFPIHSSLSLSRYRLVFSFLLLLLLLLLFTQYVPVCRMTLVMMFLKCNHVVKVDIPALNHAHSQGLQQPQEDILSI